MSAAITGILAAGELALKGIDAYAQARAKLQAALDASDQALVDQMDQQIAAKMQAMASADQQLNADIAAAENEGLKL
jgi:hypothetical protein